MMPVLAAPAAELGRYAFALNRPSKRRVRDPRGIGPSYGTARPVGSWAVVRVDDSPVFSQLIELAERARAGKDIDSDEMMRLVFQMPVVDRSARTFVSARTAFTPF
jgi:hypothetical protein